jgi:hypothetical protein
MRQTGNASPAMPKWGLRRACRAVPCRAVRILRDRKEEEIQLLSESFEVPHAMRSTDAPEAHLHYNVGPHADSRGKGSRAITGANAEPSSPQKVDHVADLAIRSSQKANRALDPDPVFSKSQTGLLRKSIRSSQKVNQIVSESQSGRLGRLTRSSQKVDPAPGSAIRFCRLQAGLLKNSVRFRIPIRSVMIKSRVPGFNQATGLKSVF